MTSLGITGHQNLPKAAVEFVLAGVQAEISRADKPIQGWTCLAAGADQLFAQEIIAAKGELNVVVPSARYLTTFLTEVQRRDYERLMLAASSILELDFPAPSEAAFLEGGRAIVARCELLIAVWDGEPAGGVGGTADIVSHAREMDVPVHVIWPDGVRR